MTEVLHVCKYYFDSDVHENLIKHLSNKHKHTTKVFVHSDLNSRSELIGNVYKFRYCSLMRFFLLFRTLLSFIYLYAKGLHLNNKIVICHTLVVDGLIGYFLLKIFNQPYVIIIRNTDINFYYKRFYFYRFLFKCVLNNASKVAFVSNANKEQFLSLNIKGLNCQSFSVWPNGIDDFWFDESFEPNRMDIKFANNFILFVGRFNDNKNLNNVVKAHSKLRSLGYNNDLVCVGGTAGEFNELIEGGVDDSIKIIPKLNKKELICYYDNASCLVVPSFNETFGLVYIEALSRQCPVICSIGQGIHSLFPECSSIQFVQPDSIISIEEAILSFVEKRLDYQDFPSVDHFSWDSSTQKIYNDLKALI